jgi:hypothetical protein
MITYVILAILTFSLAFVVSEKDCNEKNAIFKYPYRPYKTETLKLLLLSVIFPVFWLIAILTVIVNK